MSSPTSTRRAIGCRSLVVLAALTVAIATGLPAAEPAAAAPSPAGSHAQTAPCVTATNDQHLAAGRAVWLFFYWTAGSFQFLGFSGQDTTTLQSTGSGSWTRVDRCPPPTTTTTTGPTTTTTTTRPGGGRPPLEPRYTAVVEADAGLPNHTVYRPQDLSTVTDDMPIVVWGNGGCFANGTLFQTFLQPLAAHGVLVIASGAPGGSGTSTSQMLLDAIDWAVAENGRAGSKYQGRLDTDAISAQGQSCGGLEAIDAARDPRVDSTVLWNSGLFNGGDKSALERLHSPTAWFTGGPSDIAYANTVDDYGRVPAR
ncbi:MAG TPA: hypothetical protein VGO78_24915, partial [Acidimicrobiales bacterium]|nr:hypothetical protein [Acidimicrobiales bacterium]